VHQRCTGKEIFWINILSKRQKIPQHFKVTAFTKSFIYIAILLTQRYETFSMRIEVGGAIVAKKQCFNPIELILFGTGDAVRFVQAGESEDRSHDRLRGRRG